MEERPADQDSIISAVERAFASVRRGAVTLHEAEVIDNYGTAVERLEAQRHDPQDDWRDVPDSSIKECPNALHHLDPASWRFYLPAFMCFALRRIERRHSLIDRVIYSLALGDDRRLNDYARTRFETLDRHQALAVHDFLELASKNDAHSDAPMAMQALEKYWRRAAAGWPCS